MEKQFEIITKTRQVFLKVLQGLSIEQLNKVPQGFNNNLLWNFAHLIVTSQILCYKFSGLPFTVDSTLIPQYKKGTKPERFVNAEEFEVLKQVYNTSTQQLIEDYKAGRFQTYETYTNSFEIVQNSVEDAICFSAVHDGLHLGYAMALKRLI